MKEAHEVERILKQLLGMKVPAEEIQTLPLGHFYAAIGNDVKKVYVLPVGVPEGIGIEVALGKRSPESIRDEFLKVKVMESDDMYKPMFEEEKRKREEIEKEFTRQVERLSNLKAEEKIKDAKKEFESTKLSWEKNVSEMHDELVGAQKAIDELIKKLDDFEDFKQALSKMLPTNLPIRNIPQSNSTQKISLEASLTEVCVEDKAPKEISMTTETPSGKVMYSAIQLHERTLKKDSSANPTFTSAELQKEAAEYGWQIPNRSLGGTLMVMCREGQLIQEGNGYRLPSKIKIKVKETS
jgi:hypothetical protein